MYLVRNVEMEDLDDLFELSSTANFINLPHNRELIEERIKKSKQCFNHPETKLDNNYYIFVLESLENKKVIGVSIIHAQHGTEEEPHFFLKVSQIKKFSETINTGFTHGILKLGHDTNGPTEIGGLVLHPSYRGTGEKLGKLISFTRFLYMAMYPKRFKTDIHSELIPPFDKDGKSPLWEALGRKFMNMEYDEADVLSRKNKEFILSLFPSSEIYMTLLPVKARNAIGQVGEDTLPVKNMLEKIGFKYTHEVDPFDGGPHYRCKLKDIKPIKEHLELPLKLADSLKEFETYLVEVKSDLHDFSCAKIKATVDKGLLIISKQGLNTDTLNSLEKHKESRHFAIKI